jgi:hypothetical protein
MQNINVPVAQTVLRAIADAFIDGEELGLDTLAQKIAYAKGLAEAHANLRYTPYGMAIVAMVELAEDLQAHGVE